MTIWSLPKGDPYAIIESDKPHEVIQVRAGPDKPIRLYCNWIWCKFEEIVPDGDTEEADRVATEHESMNEDY